MSKELRRLKKQLLQTQPQATKQNKRTRIWILLLVLCAALVLLYRQQGVTAPQRLFEAAVRQESLGEIAAAQKLYEQIYQQYPNSDRAAEALLLSGKIWQHDRHQDQQALLCYLQLEHDYPKDKLVREAQEASAHIIKYSLHDYPRAIGIYERLLEQPGVQKDRIYYEIADSYFLLDNYTQARIELELLLEKQPETKLLPDVLYRKGGLLLLENRLADARADWQKLIAEFPKSSYSIQARFNLAKLLEEEDRLEEALAMYRQLTDFPRPDLLEEKIEHLLKRIAAKKKAI